MERDSVYFRQAQLLLRAIPFVAGERCFALKGGTAINLFHLPMPRLSVDIDLTYLPIEDRDTSLSSARAALERIVSAMMSVSPRMEAQVDYVSAEGLRAWVADAGVRVKIEINPVLRGAIVEPATMEVHPEVQEVLGFAEIQVLQRPDLYGGKICAALDRQHPRDLFDIHRLLEADGLTRQVFEGFLIYLISHGRPIAELLSPRLKDISTAYENQFMGMTEQPVSQEVLIEARDSLLRQIANRITESDKEFLLSVKRGTPQWERLSFAGVAQLPAVRWKQENIRKMTSAHRQAALSRLESVLEGL